MKEQFKEFTGEIELENITEDMFLNDEIIAEKIENIKELQDKIMEILEQKDLNIQIKITDKSFSDLLLDNEAIQDKMIEIINKNKDKI